MQTLSGNKKRFFEKLKKTYSHGQCWGNTWNANGVKLMHSLVDAGFLKRVFVNSTFPWYAFSDDNTKEDDMERKTCFL